MATVRPDLLATVSAELLLALRGPPGLDELPVDVNGVVEVQEQALAAIQKAEPENVVIDEGCGGIQDGVPEEGGQGLAVSACLHEQQGDLGAVAVHVLEI